MSGCTRPENSETVMPGAMTRPCDAPTASSTSSSICAVAAWSPRGSIAERLEVSERTIYRDIADLQASGVPIDGEAGVGYLLRSGFELPPLMFTESEIEAVAFGLRMAAAWGGARVAASAAEALRQGRGRPAGTPRQDPSRHQALRRAGLRPEGRGPRAARRRPRCHQCQAAARRHLCRRGRRPVGAHHPPARALLLGPRVDTGGVVRAAQPTSAPSARTASSRSTPSERFPRERGRELPDFLKPPRPAPEARLPCAKWLVERHRPTGHRAATARRCKRAADGTAPTPGRDSMSATFSPM